MYKPFINEVGNINLRRLQQIGRLLVVCLFIYVAYIVFKYIFLFLFPFLLALLFAMIIHPMVSFLEQKLRFSKPIAILLSMSVLLCIILVGMFFIIQELIQGSIFLADYLPDHVQAFILLLNDMIQEKIIPMYEKFLSFIQTLNQSQQMMIYEQFQHIGANIASSFAHSLRDILLSIPNLLMFVPQSLTIFIIVIIATFLIANDWHTFKNLIAKVVPAHYTRHTSNLLKHFKKSLFGLLKAEFLLITITGCFILLGLFILNIEHALTLALLIAFVDLLPILGTGVVFIPWIFYLFVTGQYALTIGLSILYGIIVISRQFLEPKIVSTHIGIHPLISLFILFLTLKLWGLAGIIISPIILIGVSAFYQAGVFHQLCLFIKDGPLISDK